MSTIATIRADALAARKEKSPSAAVLVTLIGEVDTRTKSFSPAREMTDAEVIAIVQKFIKNLDETVKVTAASNPAAAEAANAERVALERYLPTQMTEVEIEAFVKAKVAEGANMGMIMGALKTNYAGRYDGKTASQIVQRTISEAA